MPGLQARYWILTIKHADFLPYLPPGCTWIRGQLERGEQSGYLHWQVAIACSSKVSRQFIIRTFGIGVHAEPTRSDAADEYVWKEETRIPGTQFELGRKPRKRNTDKDWDNIWEAAKSGNLDDIPADIRLRLYGNIRRVQKDFMEPQFVERHVYVFWGRTGSGKSHRAWADAGPGAYPKDPNTKFWDGYSGQRNVIIDEFRGRIDISHILRWFDKYPVNVENKFGGTVLCAERIWVTSNLDPRCWYPDLDEETKEALLRRMEITHFPDIFIPATQ